jgi:hypothetical protein
MWVDAILVPCFEKQRVTKLLQFGCNKSVKYFDMSLGFSGPGCVLGQLGCAGALAGGVVGLVGEVVERDSPPWYPNPASTSPATDFIGVRPRSFPVESVADAVPPGRRFPPGSGPEPAEIPGNTRRC